MCDTGAGRIHQILKKSTFFFFFPTNVQVKSRSLIKSVGRRKPPEKHKKRKPRILSHTHALVQQSVRRGRVGATGVKRTARCSRVRGRSPLAGSIPRLPVQGDKQLLTKKVSWLLRYPLSTATHGMRHNILLGKRHEYL